MADTLVDLMDRLNRVLEDENLALSNLDLPAAGGLLSRKRDAIMALQDALAARDAAAELQADQGGMLRDSMIRMADLAEINRAAIEHGLALQMRLIQAIAQAVPRARATEAPVYQQNGSQLPSRPPEAYAFLSRM